MRYSQKVLDHFMKPHNVGKIENPDAVDSISKAM